MLQNADETSAPPEKFKRNPNNTQNMFPHSFFMLFEFFFTAPARRVSADTAPFRTYLRENP